MKQMVEGHNNPPLSKRAWWRRKGARESELAIFDVNRQRQLKAFWRVLSFRKFNNFEKPCISSHPVLLNGYNFGGRGSPQK